MGTVIVLLPHDYYPENFRHCNLYTWTHNEEVRIARGRALEDSKRKQRNLKKDDDSMKSDDEEIPKFEGDIHAMRAHLGLAPLEENPPKFREEEDGSTTVCEDGMEFRHKKAENWAEKKRQQEIKEKLETSKRKREIGDKFFKTKGLADSDSEDEGAAGWINKQRKLEEERKKAQEREKMLDDMDENYSNVAAVEPKKKLKPKRPKGSGTAGLVIGHSKESFVEMRDQILVLEDKGVLDDGEETLVNPNMLDNERYKRNVELRKRKDAAKGFNEEFDRYGNPLDKGLLAKYDEELEGYQRETFRLDEGGSFDVDKEEREMKIKKQLEIAGKTLVNMDMPKYKLASDFYTQEEMIEFRKSKKGKKDKNKIRKRGKTLKADDLVPVEPAGSSNLGSRNQGSRVKSEQNGSSKDDVVKREAEEMETDERGPWKKVTQGAVDVEKLKSFARRAEEEEESDSDEEFGNNNLANVIIDDDAEDELTSILDKARKLKQIESKPVGDSALKIHGVVAKMEEDEMDDESDKAGGIVIDSTMEYCRNIGENLTYGLAGNRTDAVDMSELQSIDESTAIANWRKANAEAAKEKKQGEKKSKDSQGGWTGPSTSDGHLDSDDERELERVKQEERDSEPDEEDEAEYVNVLGNEADVTKGVGPMLKLAHQKGYLNDPNAMRKTGLNLDHLKNKSKTQVDAIRYDIEDKYTKKLERLGTTGRGPIIPFAEKKDYTPKVNLDYVDNKGRTMDPKDAYRELSYKFHGRNPGKKQTEKRMVQREKKEMLKQMNSSDTPLGTLSKQLKKQEQLQTPYLVLSGSNRGDHTSIKKE
ncbi:unnamed protein product [Auanema sp. JU1783]|nr:unnamed protein product [Auanema sp. JU1783]